MDPRTARQPLVQEAPAEAKNGPAPAGAQALEEAEMPPVSFTSRLENRVPPEFEARSWSVDDTLAGRAAGSFRGPAAEPAPSEALREDHVLALPTLAARIGTSLSRGRTAAEAQELLARDGRNVLTPPKRTPAVVKFLMQLVSGFAPILWVAALLCFLAWWPLSKPSDPSDTLNITLAIVLVVVILLQAAFNFYQEYCSDCVMDVLTAMLPANATVVRDGLSMTVPVSELVVGDIVTVNGGEKVPADLRMISVAEMKVDKSTLNGESEPVRCTVEHTDRNIMQTRNMAFFGCNVTEGAGTGVVVATGDRTIFGEIAKLAGSQKPGQSTLHHEIQRFVCIILLLSLTIFTAAFLGWLLWLRHKPNAPKFSAQLVNCIGLIVAFVPEGMPVCVTVTLALIAKDMAKNSVLVKNLGVVETLGAVSVIASDKTGTLTENKMTVSELSCETGGQDHPEILRAMCLCNRAQFRENAVVGDASDSAFLRHYASAAAAAGAPPVAVLRDDWQKLAELPFNSTNKYMLSIHKIPGGNGDKLLLVKGAPERMIERCSTMLHNGAEEPLLDGARASLSAAITDAAARGQRVLGLCSRRLEASTYGEGYTFDVDVPNFPMKDLVFLGWAALRDPPRAGVREAIARCQQAHVRVCMVTGDMRETAQAIGRQVGIVRSDVVDDLAAVQGNDFAPEGKAVVLTGPELENLDAMQWERVCQYKEAVFSRTTPKQKLEIVKAFQSRGECVAVTGDGVNDAPALRQADCGIAMGSGSDVSKEAADLIILDDKFTNVVLGVEHGRRCFANLKKVIIYLLPAGSWAEMWPVLTSVFLAMPLALSSFLMIVVCCATDVGPSLAMVYEKPETTIMQVPPRKIGRDHLVSWKLILNAYPFIGTVIALVAYATFFSYFAAEGIHPSELVLQFEKKVTDTDKISHGQCLYFYALVVMQFGNVLTSRTARTPIWRHSPFSGPTRNLRIFAAIAVSTCFFFLICYLPFIQKSTLSTRGLPGHWVPLVLPWFGAFVLIGLNETRKVLTERFPNSFIAKCAWD